MDIPTPRVSTLITRYLKCSYCFDIIGHYVIRYEGVDDMMGGRAHYALLTDVGDIPQEKFCKRCLKGLRGTKLSCDG